MVITKNALKLIVECKSGIIIVAFSERVFLTEKEK